MNNKYAVQFIDVVREYTNGNVTIRALDGISFSLLNGGFNVIVGPSGAGKSTVLNILGGMDTVTGGHVLAFSQEITKLKSRARCLYRRNDVGFVFQFYNLIQNLTALENVELATHICKNAYDPKAILRDVGLTDRMYNFPSQLSGGEQQRVAIARALAKKPKLLLCDEPTGALDYETGKGILSLLYDTCRKNNVTVVVITHNSAITPMADRIIKIKSGKAEYVMDNPSPVPVEEIEW
ncbi:MAG: ABC transporter ATP-binding protein [Firmicutes bacterium]|nr:ABC transporter ATP-binding protein [Bacillota bacterium]